MIIPSNAWNNATVHNGAAYGQLSSRPGTIIFINQCALTQQE